jgi:hypothetical protein
MHFFISSFQQSVDSKSREFHILQDSTLSEKRKNQERITTLLRDLNDVGVILGTKMEEKLQKLDPTTEFTDEDFTKARIHLSNMRCEVRTLAKQREVLEVAEREARERAQGAVTELSACRTKISEVSGVGVPVRWLWWGDRDRGVALVMSQIHKTCMYQHAGHLLQLFAWNI